MLVPPGSLLRDIQPIYRGGAGVAGRRVTNAMPFDLLRQIVLLPAQQIGLQSPDQRG